MSKNNNFRSSFWTEGVKKTTKKKFKLCISHKSTFLSKQLNFMTRLFVGLDILQLDLHQNPQDFRDIDLKFGLVVDETDLQYTF